MYVPATTPLVAPTMPNGETPISAGQIARSQAYLFRVNTAADNAKAAVLGSCQVPVSLTDTGTPLSTNAFSEYIGIKGVFSIVPVAWYYFFPPR